MNNDLKNLIEADQREKEDEILVDMSHSLDNLHDSATTIQTELKSQEKEIAGLDDNIDQGNGNLEIVNTRLDRIMNSMNKKDLRTCIAIFIILITILIIFLLTS
ncbi:MAG: hypothetical protein Edafosvirus5_21 [Edafosvirus sp.]|uniref:t-SNARE coiled-coil homology domain-containing protein n=1 Tax=Edafosvirus sp. TaxID=2487765 RepID=A0A3G4ZWY3_9VIRU|nr:MAG: hypothetical protein Edafosvirus5_21 [Edafosvirus sp.]